MKDKWATYQIQMRYCLLSGFIIWNDQNLRAAYSPSISDDVIHWPLQYLLTQSVMKNIDPSTYRSVRHVYSFISLYDVGMLSS